RPNARVRAAIASSPAGAYCERRRGFRPVRRGPYTLGRREIEERRNDERGRHGEARYPDFSRQRQSRAVALRESPGAAQGSRTTYSLLRCRRVEVTAAAAIQRR